MANIKKMTHTCRKTGIAHNRGMIYKIKIRFTKKYIVDEYGTKYSIINGYPIGEKFATFILDIDTIKEIVE